MTWERQQYYAFQNGKEEGLLEGKQQKALDDATNFLRESIPPETIAKCVGLPLEQVLEIQKQIEKATLQDPSTI